MLPRNDTMLPVNSSRKSGDVRSGLKSMLMRLRRRALLPCRAVGLSSRGEDSGSSGGRATHDIQKASEAVTETPP
jgi:hypothetical protein